MDETKLEDRLYGFENAAYDQNAKSFLASRKMLAEILKRTTSEFRSVPLQQIAETCIEGTPLVGKAPVNPGRTNAAPQSIRGGRNEDGAPGEGYVTYDILFHARVPGTGERIALIVNVEAQRTQNKTKLHYVLLHRAVFYACRLVSSQKEREFTGSQYDDIKKVYSIWICMDSPNGESAINRYGLDEKHLLHHYKEPQENYDLLNIVMIYLGKRADKDRLIHLLQVLFTESEKSAAEKAAILNKEYGIELTKDMEEELRTMCNLSMGIAEKAYVGGLAEGRAKGRAEGRAKGRAEGAERLGRLMSLLLSRGLVKEAARAAADREERERLFAQYGL